MSSKEIPKKIILAVLSFIFFTFAPLAINAFLIKQAGVGNTITAILEGVASETFTGTLKQTCDKQGSLTYQECEVLVLDNLCAQYADKASCVGIGEKGKDYFIRNVVLPNAVSKVNELRIPKTDIKVSELDTIVNNLFVISIALTLVSVILMVMVISTPENVLKTLGMNVILVGLPMFILAYLGAASLPALVEQGGADLGSPELVSAVSTVIMENIGPLLESQKQIGVLLTVLGLAAIAASKTLFREKRLLRK
ncbi:MAG: hypothetical protein HYS53_02285 [Candidatus Aenigmarchaeota archaeon]|nr:hypothetical protein [Candidatus Aenigmarchaeota archaeon]